MQERLKRAPTSSNTLDMKQDIRSQLEDELSAKKRELEKQSRERLLNLRKEQQRESERLKEEMKKRL